MKLSSTQIFRTIQLAARTIVWGVLVVGIGTVMFFSVWAYYFAFGGAL